MSRTSELVWTEARIALLRKLVAEGVTRHDAVPPLAALPGAPITNHKQIAYQMHVLGLRLTKERRREIWSKSVWKDRTYSYTPERRAYLEQAYPAGVPKDEIMAALAAMDGPPLAGWDAIISYATKIGLHRPPRVRDMARERERRRKAAREYNARRTAKNQVMREPKPRKPVIRKAAESKPKPAKTRVMKVLPTVELTDTPEHIEPSPEIADASIEMRHARVKALLRKDRSNAEALAKVHRLPLREVYRLDMERRREMVA